MIADVDEIRKTDTLTDIGRRPPTYDRDRNVGKRGQSFKAGLGFRRDSGILGALADRRERPVEIEHQEQPARLGEALRDPRPISKEFLHS